MMKAFYFGAAGLLVAASVARAECEDLQNLSLPLSGDTTLELSSAAIDCAIVDVDQLEEFVIEGGTLTLTGPSTTTFSNMRFTVMDGASLIFDFPMTEFGPSVSGRQDDYASIMLNVMSGGSAKFTGEMTADRVGNMESVFGNAVDGSIEFASRAVFDNCNANVFLHNYGSLRFRGDATFISNEYIVISNEGGTLRVDGDTVFEGNGRSFDGHNGGAISNTDGGKAIFHGHATFTNNWCDIDGGALFNGPDSKITFYKKAGFYDNTCRGGDGGAVDNHGGNIKFRGSVVATGNQANSDGGGISTADGGTTTFYGWTTIQSNKSFLGAGGLSVYKSTSQSEGGSVVTFRRSNKIRISDNESERGCNNVFVEETSELIGYDADTTSNICD